MANERTRARIAARIKERAAYCIKFELSDPRAGFITITEVEVAGDLSAARIHYSVLGTASEKNQTEHMLKKAAGFIQRQVGRVLQTRTVPRLSFIYDDRLERAADMDATIRAALDHDRKINPAAHQDLPDADVETQTDARDDEGPDTQPDESGL